MKFKQPRDPNTKSISLKLYDIPASANRICQVGSGECKKIAVEAQDDGEGGEFLLCEQHAVEFEDLGKLIAEMAQSEIERFEEIIKKAEGK